MRGIKKGEELRIDYVGADVRQKDKKQQLEQVYGFMCDVNHAVTIAVRTRRSMQTS